MGFRSLIAILGHGANYYCRISGSFIPPVIDVAVCISRKEMRRRRLSSPFVGLRLHAIRASDTNFFSGLVGFNFAPADVYFGRGQTILLEEKGPNAKPSNTGFTAKIAEKLA
jgi:hypothetical protein